jgi:hypothetical protein
VPVPRPTRGTLITGGLSSSVRGSPAAESVRILTNGEVADQCSGLLSSGFESLSDPSAAENRRVSRADHRPVEDTAP